MEQVCERCPPNTISVDGGFILDAKMDDVGHLASQVAENLLLTCRTVKLNTAGSVEIDDDEYEPVIVSYDCP